MGFRVLATPRNLGRCYCCWFFCIFECIFIRKSTEGKSGLQPPRRTPQSLRRGNASFPEHPLVKTGCVSTGPCAGSVSVRAGPRQGPAHGGHAGPFEDKEGWLARWCRGRSASPARRWGIGCVAARSPHPQSSSARPRALPAAREGPTAASIYYLYIRSYFTLLIIPLFGYNIYIRNASPLPLLTAASALMHC